MTCFAFITQKLSAAVPLDKQLFSSLLTTCLFSAYCKLKILIFPLQSVTYCTDLKDEVTNVYLPQYFVVF